MAMSRLDELRQIIADNKAKIEELTPENDSEIGELEFVIRAAEAEIDDILRGMGS